MSAPTRTATPWTATGEGKRAAVHGLFSQIASRYDRLNGVMTFGLHRRWRAIAVQELHLSAGDSALDVCCGTGDFLKPLRQAVGPSGRLSGVDFCAPMLALANQKDAGALLVVGDACSLPSATNSVDAVTVGWGIRNVPDLDAAHREAFRVLRSGGRFASIDMALPPSPAIRSIFRLLLRAGLPLMGALSGSRTAYAYLAESTQRFATRHELKASMEAVGFVDVRWRDFALGNVCLHMGRKP